MSMNFTANQFEAEYKASKLRNWEIPRWYPERPCGYKGKTKVVSNENGHLLPGVPRSLRNPWGNFVGTWDLPKKISREEAFKLSAPTLDKIQKWRQHCIQQGCPPPPIPKITTTSRQSREAVAKQAALVRQKAAEEKKLAEEEIYKGTVETAHTTEQTYEIRHGEAVHHEALLGDGGYLKEHQEGESDEHMDGLEKTHVCCPDKNKYTPGEFTDPHLRHPSHKDLVLGIYQQHIEDHKGRGYPRYKDDFLAPTSDELRCSHKDEEKMNVFGTRCAKEQPRKKGSSPYLAAAKNFVFAKRLHKENLEHKPLPDTIADAMYRKTQMKGGEPGLMLKDGNYATGVGWKGYPGYGATRCTKLKVYRPKTCVHTESANKKRPVSVSSFDKKWRFIRQQKVTPIELAICWDMTPVNPRDEPELSVHIDGSNGSQAPAVFALVHTPKENIEKIAEECNCSPREERPKTAIEKECQTLMKRTKSAFNFNNKKSTKSNEKCYKSTPNLTDCSTCTNCSRKNDLLPNARLCVACELKGTKPKQKPKSEFKAAFKAGVPNNSKSVSVANSKVPVKVPRQKDPYKVTNYVITSLAPPFSFQSGKRHEYPDHWRLASVYQHSYKPLHLRKRSLLASIFL